MPERLELLAPAKINLTLEVLRRRADGYHEIATLMQTIDLCDRVVLETSSNLSLEVRGPAASGTPQDPARDLAFRAAESLAVKAGLMRSGARISLEKSIPAGMGLGGGSSDAAAVLRGLNRLWRANLRPDTLNALAAALGSDVAFFLHGGTAVCTGRGEVVGPLPDCPPVVMTLFLPSGTIENKTASMYQALAPASFTDASATAALADRVRAGLGLGPLTNAFETCLPRLGGHLEAAFAACRSAGFEVRLCGSGPAFFALRPKEDIGPGLLHLLTGMGIRALEQHFLPRAEALRETRVG
jgi:4-diphosphocytidyl-2-C-methyl-D-erythritol kinase